MNIKHLAQSMEYIKCLINGSCCCCCFIWWDLLGVGVSGRRVKLPSSGSDSSFTTEIPEAGKDNTVVSTLSRMGSSSRYPFFPQLMVSHSLEGYLAEFREEVRRVAPQKPQRANTPFTPGLALSHVFLDLSPCFREMNTFLSSSDFRDFFPSLAPACLTKNSVTSCCYHLVLLKKKPKTDSRPMGSFLAYHNVLSPQSEQTIGEVLPSAIFWVNV